jgi:hypothetical protein
VVDIVCPCQRKKEPVVLMYSQLEIENEIENNHEIVQQKENDNALHPSDSVIRVQLERKSIIMRLRTMMLYYDIL